MAVLLGVQRVLRSSETAEYQSNSIAGDGVYSDPRPCAVALPVCLTSKVSAQGRELACMRKASIVHRGNLRVGGCIVVRSDLSLPLRKEVLRDKLSY